LLSPSEEVTKTWVKRKGILIKSRPEPTRFSFAICLSIVFSIVFGFLGGFITAGFALNENYGSVYESLLTELAHARHSADREREKLITMNRIMENAPLEPTLVRHVSTNELKRNRQAQLQANFNRFIRMLDCHGSSVDSP